MALMARAHVWDHTRINKDGFEEEYDDYSFGDDPTCCYGIRRQAFEAVVSQLIKRINTRASKNRMS